MLLWLPVTHWVMFTSVFWPYLSNSIYATFSWKLDECNCVVVWAFFGISFLWDWNANWPFPVLWPRLSFPNLLAYWVQHFHSIIFRMWNSSTGIPSPPLAFFVVMIPKAHSTSHSRMSGSRWVIPSSCLSGSWRSFFACSFCLSQAQVLL